MGCVVMHPFLPQNCFFSLRHCTFLHVSISIWLRTQATFANDVVALGELFALRATAVLVRQWASVENLLIYRECKRPLERTMLRMKSGKYQVYDSLSFYYMMFRKLGRMCCTRVATHAAHRSHRQYTRILFQFTVHVQFCSFAGSLANHCGRNCGRHKPCIWSPKYSHCFRPSQLRNPSASRDSRDMVRLDSL